MQIFEKLHCANDARQQKTKLLIDTLEVLIHANYVLPPIQTKCKRHEKMCQPRKFLDTEITKCTKKMEKLPVYWVGDIKK